MDGDYYEDDVGQNDEESELEDDGGDSESSDDRDRVISGLHPKTTGFFHKIVFFSFFLNKEKTNTKKLL